MISEKAIRKSYKNLDISKNAFYSRKINELIQSSQAVVYFFYSTPAKNTSHNVKFNKKPQTVLEVTHSFQCHFLK